MTRGNTHVRPDRYAGYERRFDAYARAIGSLSVPFAVTGNLGPAADETLKRSRGATALHVRSLPDRLVLNPRMPEKGTKLIEIKARERDNIPFNAVQLLNFVHECRAGYDIAYVIVPPVGPFLMVSPLAIVRKPRVISLSPESDENEECLRLAEQEGFGGWRKIYRLPKVGTSDPYVLVMADEVMTWRCLLDSANVPPVEEISR